MGRTEREHARYAHEAAVKFRAGKRMLEGRTRNVSRGGLCATLADPLSIGDDVELELVLVFEDETHSGALKLPARVVWCTPVDDAHQIGVVFRPIDEHRTEQLALFLSHFEDEQAEKSTGKPPVDERFG